LEKRKHLDNKNPPTKLHTSYATKQLSTKQIPTTKDLAFPPWVQGLEFLGFFVATKWCASRVLQETVFGFFKGVGGGVLKGLLFFYLS